MRVPGAGRWSLRHGIVGFATAFAVVLVMLQAYDLWREREAVITSTGARTETLARVLEEHARQTLQRVEARLTVTRNALRPAGDLGRLAADELRALLAPLAPASGQIKALVVIGRDGRFLASTGPLGASGGLNAGDNDYFTAHRDAKPGAQPPGMIVATPVKGWPDGKWVLPATMRLETAAGDFAGVLMAVIDQEYLGRFYASLEVGPNGGVALFTRQGHIAARWPFVESFMGRAWNDSPMFREHLARSDTGTVRQVVVADGVERIYSYRALKDYPVVVYLGLSLSDSLAGWRNEVGRQALILLFILAVTWQAVRMLLQQLDLREQSELAFARSEARFRSLTELSSDWYWEQDHELRFTYFSSGYGAGARNSDARSVIGKRRWEQGNLGLSEAQWAEHRAVLEARKPFHDLELSRLDTAGDALHFLVSGEPVFDAAGAFSGYRGVGRDVSEVREAQRKISRINASLEARVAERTAELDSAVQELESFCYTLAHDMRAPLRTVTSFASLVLEDHGADLPESARADLGRIAKGARAMGAQLDELLAFARLAREPIHRGRVNMAALAREVCAAERMQSPGRAVELCIDDLPDSEADAAQLREALRHLVSNAFKFTAQRDPARVTIAALPKRENGQVVYVVRDNGIGFDMRYAARLFGVFQRMHTEPQYQGIGAGLAIVRRIITLHGGRVWAEARVGDGASFYFALPAADPEPVAA